MGGGGDTSTSSSTGTNGGYKSTRNSAGGWDVTGPGGYKASTTATGADATGRGFSDSSTGYDKGSWDTYNAKEAKRVSDAKTMRDLGLATSYVTGAFTPTGLTGLATAAYNQVEMQPKDFVASTADMNFDPNVKGNAAEQQSTRDSQNAMARGESGTGTGSDSGATKRAPRTYQSDQNADTNARMYSDLTKAKTAYSAAHDDWLKYNKPADELASREGVSGMIKTKGFGGEAYTKKNTDAYADNIGSLSGNDIKGWGSFNDSLTGVAKQGFNSQDEANKAWGESYGKLKDYNTATQSDIDNLNKWTADYDKQNSDYKNRQSSITNSRNFVGTDRGRGGKDTKSLFGLLGEEEDGGFL